MKVQDKQTENSDLRELVSSLQNQIYIEKQKNAALQAELDKAQATD